MNTLLEEFYRFHEVFQVFNGLQNEYNWLLTDLADIYPDEFRDNLEEYRIKNESYWIAGENISKFVDHHEYYLTWGVFSAFPKQENIDLDNLEFIPYADGNPEFWVPNPKIQHPKAVVELVFWDSSLILLLSKNDKFSNRFRDSFNKWIDLDIYNQT